MKNAELNHYPTIKQGWGIVGISILAMIVFGVVYVLLNPVIGPEATFLVYYLLSMGTAFWIAHQNRIKWTHVSIYNLDLASAKTIILVSIAAIAIQVGVISPIASLIPMPEFMKDIFIELAKQNGVPMSFT